MENYENNQEKIGENVLCQTRDYLEKIMGKLPRDNTDNERRNYLAGIIDCLSDIKIINESQREILYLEYAM